MSTDPWKPLPFVRLVLHFLARLVGSGRGSDSREFDFGVGPLLGLLAAPGAFCSMVLFQKYSTLSDFILHRHQSNIDAMSAPDKYFFICLAMAVAGVVTAIKWDKILPDSQDYLNLMPLPLRPRGIVLANATAIAIAVLVLAVDVNGSSTILFPAIVSAYSNQGIGAIFMFAAAHAICLMLASLFAFCAVFALLGMLAIVLPREAFRACSSWVRGFVLIGSVMLLPTNIHQSMSQYLPPMWFLGLYQELMGRSSPLILARAHIALEAFAAAIVLMAATYLLTCRSSFAAVLESGRPPSQQRILVAVFAFLDLFAKRAAGFDRACHRFIVRAMLRSEPHRMCLAVAVGFGWLFAFAQISDGSETALMEAPLTAAYLLILGLRLGFEIPSSVASNWIFRSVLDARSNQTIAATRRVVLSFLAPVVLAPAFVLGWRQWGIGMALVHTVYVLALSLCLSDLFLAGYRKIPLTCPMPGFRDNLLALCLMQIVGFALFTQFGARLEQWMWLRPWRFLLVPMAMAAAWLWNLHRIAEAREAGELDESLTFENIEAPVVERLDLFDADLL